MSREVNSIRFNLEINLLRSANQKQTNRFVWLFDSGHHCDALTFVEAISFCLNCKYAYCSLSQSEDGAFSGFNGMSRSTLKKMDGETRHNALINRLSEVIESSRRDIRYPRTREENVQAQPSSVDARIHELFPSVNNINRSRPSNPTHADRYRFIPGRTAGSQLFH